MDDTMKLPPSRMHVAIDFSCSSCDRIGKRQRMALVGRDTYPEGDQEPWVRSWKVDGLRNTPKFTDNDDLLLICSSCGHAPDPIPKALIVARLDAMWSENTRQVDRVLM